MSQTIIGLGDAKAVKRYSAFLAVDTARISYWQRKFMGYGEDSGLPLQLLPQLESDAGERITFDLNMQMRGQPIEGDATQRGTEEALRFFTDEVIINQMRGGVNTGGRMSRKRTVHDMRKIARRRQSEWWGRIFDELFFMYLSGARGINPDYIFPTSYPGFASNSFQAPDTNHVLYGGNATGKADVDANDKADLALLDRAVTKATMLGGGVESTPALQPVMVEGEERFVALFNPFQVYDLRTNTNVGQWLDIQKAAAAAEGRSNPIFKGSLGMYNDVVMHQHKGVIRFNDYGAGANVEAARGLFLGRQAAVVAFGNAGSGLRFSWHEETEDRGNQIVITTSSIFGVKKTNFTIDGSPYDFGVVALDTAAADPNP